MRLRVHGLTRERAVMLRAIDQIRDALAPLCYAADGHYEDEAQHALDALDWIESELGLDMIRPEAPSSR